MLHTYHGLVHKAIWTIAYHTKRYMIPLGTSCSFVCWSISWSTLYLFFSIDDVLKITMNDHLILFFKTYLQYAQLAYDQSSDNYSNNNLVITYSSSWSYQIYPYNLMILMPNTPLYHYLHGINLESNIWSSIFGLWTNTTRITQYNH